MRYVLFLLILVITQSVLAVEIGNSGEKIPAVIMKTDYVCYLNQNNVFTGNNTFTGNTTFTNVTIINQSVLNVNNSICLNGVCINDWGSGNSSFNESLTNSLYIKLDGTSTTTAEIPFARGIQISSDADGTAIGALTFDNILYSYLDADKAKVSYDSGTNELIISGVNSKDADEHGGGVNLITGNGFETSNSGILDLRTGDAGATNADSGNIFMVTGSIYGSGNRGKIYVTAGDIDTPSKITLDAGLNGNISLIGNVTAQNLCYSNGSQCPVASVSTYYPAVVSTKGGTNTTSNISLLFDYDGKTYNITEGSGANPLTFYMNYTGITSFSEWVIREYYLGSSGHNIQFEIYDYPSASWESYYSIVGQSGFNVISMPIFDSADHISGGIVQTRLIHIENGISSHKLYIDFSWLQITSTIASSIDLTGYAKYNFSVNNFDGTGKFTTTNNITARNLFLDNPLVIVSGGTGNNTFRANSLIRSGASVTTSLSSIVTGATAGMYVTSNGAGSPQPVWSSMILPTSATIYQIFYATASNTMGSGTGLTYDGNKLNLSAIAPSFRLSDASLIEDDWSINLVEDNMTFYNEDTRANFISINPNTNMTSFRNMIELSVQTLPTCNAQYNGTIARNATGLYYCKNDATWFRLDI